MSTQTKDTVTLSEVNIIAETEKAILLTRCLQEDGAPSKDWFPLSATHEINNTGKKDLTSSVVVDRWIAVKKGWYTE